MRKHCQYCIIVICDWWCFILASEMLMKKLSLLCDDDFVDLDKNIIQKIFTDHFSDLLNDPEIIQKPLRPCVLSNVELLMLDFLSLNVPTAMILKSFLILVNPNSVIHAVLNTLLNVPILLNPSFLIVPTDMSFLR